MAQATAPILDSTFCDMPGRAANVRYWGEIGLNADIGLWVGFWTLTGLATARLDAARHRTDGMALGPLYHV
jgi:hypothetical protein